MHRAFLTLNRFLAVPMLRAGLGPWVGTPIGGYLLLLRARGRRSGAIRETPLSYLVAEGAIWVCAGMGPRTQWYRNLQVDPRVEVVLPGRTVSCLAEDVRDHETRARMIPALVRAVGLPGALGGVNPRTATDAQITDAYAWVPLLRLRPLDGPVARGPDDPGGTAWVWRQAVVLVVTIMAARSLIDRTRWVIGRR
jgi:deazaflavin-dependent oxidoreductase (nitroreductase family)